MYRGAKNGYWGNIKEAIVSLLEGLKLTLQHLWEAKDQRAPMGIDAVDYFDQKKGIVTLQYPKESFPVPDNGRYRLHNEIEDCIVCDKCAKICPVNCIEIEPVRAIDEDLGKTSDGTPKRIYAATFDIDMGKCCFCGLCTTVCPTECLTMTKAYDFSEFDVADHVYAFAEMTPLEILEKKERLAAYNEAKAAAVESRKAPDEAVKAAKPAFKPRAVPKPPGSTPSIEQNKEATDKQKDNEDQQGPGKPVFKPRVKAVIKKEDEVDKNVSEIGNKPKPVFKPKIKQAKPVTKIKTEEPGETGSGSSTELPPGTNAGDYNFPTKEEQIYKDAIKESNSLEDPKQRNETQIKPVTSVQNRNTEGGEREKSEEGQSTKLKPVFRPKIKPVIKNKEEAEEKPAIQNKQPKPVFKPKIKPKNAGD